MKSLEILEELNKMLIEADKLCNASYESVGEQDKIRGDLEHDLLNTYSEMKSKDKTKFTDMLYECLIERHACKYKYREYEILKELYNITGLKRGFNDTICKLRKLNQEQETPIYYKRAKKNQGEKILVNKKEVEEKEK